MEPTEETYAELQQAFNFFNDTLFSGDLPAGLITLQRKKHSCGYFSAQRFVNRAGDKTDEIALNPAYFAVRPLEEVMGTVVHEMAHQWQAHYGSPGRRRYHNDQWADKMEELGLMPSDTGRPGGKRTGESMSHYIIDGGPFQIACRQLLTTFFRLSWMDRFPPREILAALLHDPEPGPAAPGISIRAAPEGNGEAPGIVPPPPPAGGERPDIETIRSWGIQVDPEPNAPTNRSNRAKYSCPKCGVNVWGKPGLNIVCGDCEQGLQAVM